MDDLFISLLQTWLDYKTMSDAPEKNLDALPLAEVFPNPTSGQVFVRLKNWEEKTATLTLFNALGVRVLEKQNLQIFGAAEPLELFGLPPGQYFLKMETVGKKMVLGRVVVF